MLLLLLISMLVKLMLGMVLLLLYPSTLLKLREEVVRYAALYSIYVGSTGAANHNAGVGAPCACACATGSNYAGTAGSNATSNYYSGTAP